MLLNSLSLRICIVILLCYLFFTVIVHSFREITIAVGSANIRHMIGTYRLRKGRDLYYVTPAMTQSLDLLRSQRKDVPIQPPSTTSKGDVGNILTRISTGNVTMQLCCCCFILKCWSLENLGVNRVNKSRHINSLVSIV